MRSRSASRYTQRALLMSYASHRARSVRLRASRYTQRALLMSYASHGARSVKLRASRYSFLRNTIRNHYIIFKTCVKLKYSPSASIIFHAVDGLLDDASDHIFTETSCCISINIAVFVDHKCGREGLDSISCKNTSV